MVLHKRMSNVGVGEYLDEVGLIIKLSDTVFSRDSKIRWTRPLHEHIIGCKTYSHLPPQEELSLYHPKTKDKQEQQNKFYMDNFNKELLVRG